MGILHNHRHISFLDNWIHHTALEKEEKYMVSYFKTSLLLLIIAPILFGCSISSDKEKLNKEVNYLTPDYLAVYQAFQKTPDYQECEAYADIIDETGEHPDYPNIYPYLTETDMDIVQSNMSNGEYKAELKCVVTAKYQLNAFLFIEEKFEKPLNTMFFKIEHDENGFIKYFEPLTNNAERLSF